MNSRRVCLILYVIKVYRKFKCLGFNISRDVKDFWRRFYYSFSVVQEELIKEIDSHCVISKYKLISLEVLSIKK